MKYLSGIFVAVLTLMGASEARSANVVYQGTIALPIATVNGSVGGFGFVREVAADVDFWSFSAKAGDWISIQGTRLQAALDPTLDLYFGTTSADDSLFRTGESWGGLQFLASADDEVEPPTGPFGDPLLSFQLPSTGNYTIAIGGSGSDGEGPYPYALTVQAVPEPSTAWLLLGGVAAIACLRKRRSRN